MTAYVARWTPLGTRWSLTIEDGTKVVRYKRTDIPASQELPGSEHMLGLGFGAFPGGRWQQEPGGWFQVVEPVSRQFAAELAATRARDPGQQGS